MTLTEFLLVRIAEDEQVARYLTSGYAQHKPTWCNPSTGVVDIGDPGLDGLHPLGDGPLAIHIARWDPERVLAECEAKRRIVTEWGPFETYNGAELLKVLALPYADHPDYRQEWRP